MKTLFALLFIFFSTCATAQEVFEGEIVYETFENYSDAMLKLQTYSPMYNGVHRCRLIIKGDKAHIIDETTHSHRLYIPFTSINGRKGFSTSANPGNIAWLWYSDDIENALFYDTDASLLPVLANKDLTIGEGMFATTLKIEEYDFSPKDKTKEFCGANCSLYSGKMSRNTLGRIGVVKGEFWIDKTVKMPELYKIINYGVECDDRLIYAYSYNSNQGHVKGSGEVSTYIEMNVIKVIPRTVSDSEFEIPASKKFNNGYSMKALKAQKDIAKQLTKIGIKALDEDMKTTGVHFKTEDEWNF